MIVSLANGFFANWLLFTGKDLLIEAGLRMSIIGFSCIVVLQILVITITVQSHIDDYK